MGMEVINLAVSECGGDGCCGVRGAEGREGRRQPFNATNRLYNKSWHRQENREGESVMLEGAR